MRVLGVFTLIFVLYSVNFVHSKLVEVSKGPPPSSSEGAEEYRNLYGCVLSYNVFEYVRNFKNLHSYVSLLHRELSDGHKYCFSVLAQTTDNILAYKLYSPWIVVRETNVANRSVDIIVTATPQPYSNRISGGSAEIKKKLAGLDIAGKSGSSGEEPDHKPGQIAIESSAQGQSSPQGSSDQIPIQSPSKPVESPIKILSKRSLDHKQHKQQIKPSSHQQPKPIAEVLSVFVDKKDKLDGKQDSKLDSKLDSKQDQPIKEHDKVKPIHQLDAIKDDDIKLIKDKDGQIVKDKNILEHKCDEEKFRIVSYGQAIGQGDHWELIKNLTKEVFGSLQPGVDVNYQTITDKLSEEIGKQHEGISQPQWSVLLQRKTQDLISYQFQDDAYYAIWEWEEFSIVAWANSCRV